MTMKNCFYLALIAALLCLTGGCTIFKPSSENARYYILTATTGPASTNSTAAPSNSGMLVRIRSLEVADYLKGRDMPIRTDPNELVLDLFHQWAEPLDEGLRRVLTEDLQQSPLVHNVSGEQPSTGSSNVYTFSLQILACEGVRHTNHSSVRFEAAWTLRSENGGVLDHGVFKAKPASWDGQNYGQLAQQISEAVGEFASALLNALAQRAQPPHS